MEYRVRLGCPYCDADLGEYKDHVPRIVTCYFCDAVLEEDATEEEIEQSRERNKKFREVWLEEYAEIEENAASPFWTLGSPE